jgi:hypothetical protein
MKKNPLLVILFIMLSPVLFAACGNGKVNDGSKYVIFYTGFQLQYFALFPGKTEISVDYDVTKSYTFNYMAYYKYDDRSTGEEGQFSYEAYEPGTYYFSATTTEGDYILAFTINAPPDNRVEPDISFDPRGAESYIENTEYRYKYDGYAHFPTIQLTYNGENIELVNVSNHHIISVVNQDDIHVGFPANRGTYSVSYMVFSDNYQESENPAESDRNKYLSVAITITIVIEE